MTKAMGKSTTKRSMVTTGESTPEYVCPHCGKIKKASEFYVSTDPAVVIGVAFPCKDCSENIARRYDPRTGEYSDMTEASLKSALMYLDKPFIRKLWDSAYNEVHNENLKQPKKNMWKSYIKNVTSLSQYRGLRWRDGDFDDTKVNEEIYSETTTLQQNQEVLEECEKNRRDIIRLIGYDPFEKEAPEDKPLLYAQLIGYIDMSGDNEDMTRVLDSIEIVRGYLQLQKLNDMSAKAFATLSKTGQSGEIKNYMDTKKKVADVISQLAEQSCISMKHNKNASKGENTFAGKIKKLKELNLREAELNAFDIGTCEGMRQVADISNASIIKQLHLDESDYTEMLAQQREMITKLQQQADTKTEEARILLRENLDLKSYIQSQGLDISEHLSSDTILYTE
jgi:predicted RNA-binding Zn-ribbon protein involved in translation (DUF1610 family)